MRPLSRKQRTHSVRRDYKVDFDQAKVSENAGVWLQGCNEGHTV